MRHMIYSVTRQQEEINKWSWNWPAILIVGFFVFCFILALKNGWNY